MGNKLYGKNGLKMPTQKYQFLISSYTNIDFGWGGYEIIMSRGEK